jgi:hypothetical protein
MYILSFKTSPDPSLETKYNIKFDVHADEINEICEESLNIHALFDNSRVSKHIISGPNRLQRKERLWYILWFMTKGRIPSSIPDEKIKKRCDSLLPFDSEGNKVPYKSRYSVMVNAINTLFRRIE